MFNLLIDVHWCPLYIQTSLSATNRFTSLFQSGNEKVETVIFHLSTRCWTEEPFIATIGICKTWNHTNSSKPAHCFVTCRRTKQRTSLLVYNPSALHAANVSWKAVSGTVNSTLLPLALSASCCAKAVRHRQPRSKSMRHWPLPNWGPANVLEKCR